MQWTQKSCIQSLANIPFMLNDLEGVVDIGYFAGLFP